MNPEKKLTAQSYGVDYYEQHKDAGLDYLGHGTWQEDYGAWIVESLNLRDKPVLDIGCACGSIAAGFGLAGAEISGCDVNEHMIKLGRDTFNFAHDRLRICDASNLHYWRDNTFDLIHSAQAFEHFNPVAVPAILSEIYRVLKPGGSLLVFLDTVELFERQGRKMENEDPTHICVKTMEWWQSHLDCAGFKLVQGLDESLSVHPKNFLTKYDWDWFITSKPKN